MSCDNDATRGFGPLLLGNLKVDFGDSDSLEKIFKGLKMLRSSVVITIISFPRLTFELERMSG